MLTFTQRFPTKLLTADFHSGELQDIEASYLRCDSRSPKGDSLLRERSSMSLTRVEVDYKDGCLSEALVSEYKTFHPILGRTLRFELP